MDSILLSPRLQRIADLVRDGTHLTDVGTDHAYIPIRLLQDNRIPFAIATDINLKPLNRGFQSARDLQVGDRISFRLSDGLEQVKEEETDGIVIAGMGGCMIIRILERCLWWSNYAENLIIQPMTKLDVVRKWFWMNQYSFTEELVMEDDTIYHVFHHFHKEALTYSDVDAYFGRISREDPLYDEYKQRVLSKVKRVLNGLSKANKQTQEDKAIEYMNLLKKIEETK